MLVRSVDGKLEEINITDFITDEDYYKKMMAIKISS